MSNQPSNEYAPIGAGRITLDRTNLERLIAVAAAVPNRWPDDIPADVRKGWQAACEAMGEIAKTMPDLYGDNGALGFGETHA